MRWYRHLTTKALIEPHHITCISLDISVLILRPSTCVQSRYPYEPSAQTRHPSTKVSWLAIELSDKIVSDDGLSFYSNEAIHQRTVLDDNYYTTG